MFFFQLIKYNHQQINTPTYKITTSTHQHINQRINTRSSAQVISTSHQHTLSTHVINTRALCTIVNTKNKQRRCCCNREKHTARARGRPVGFQTEAFASSPTGSKDNPNDEDGRGTAGLGFTDTESDDREGIWVPVFVLGSPESSNDSAEKRRVTSGTETAASCAFPGSKDDSDEVASRSLIKWIPSGAAVPTVTVEGLTSLRLKTSGGSGVEFSRSNRLIPKILDFVCLERQLINRRKNEHEYSSKIIPHPCRVQKLR
jgi:hypothetical protein